MFLNGRAAMTVGAWIVRSVRDTTNFPHTFVTGFAPYPVSDRFPAINNPGGVGDVHAINPRSRNTDAAWEYIKWYSTNGIVNMAAGGRLGLYAGLNQQELTNAFLQGAEHLLDARTTMDHYIAPRPNIVYPRITFRAPELTVIVNETLEAIYNGRMTIDAGLVDMEARANRILAQ
jgi:multiple sugar transport system substrate-binding protein